MCILRIVGRRNNRHSLAVIESVSDDWRNVLKPGDKLSKDAYDYIRNSSRLHGVVDVFSRSVTPEYFQVEESVPIRSGFNIVYHTFDWDVRFQKSYIYHGLCSSGSTKDESSHVTNEVN